MNKTLKTPLLTILGIKHPIMLAGMGGVSYAELTAAVSEAGGAGCIGGSSFNPDQLRDEMRKVRSLTNKPFGVDILVPDPSLVDPYVDTIIKEGASFFVAAIGVPFDAIKRFKKAGLTVMNMCGKVRHAQKAVDAGADVIIAQGTGAGGHTGTIDTMALIPEVVDAVDVPVVGAGCIVDGRGLAAALSLGAIGVWCGTRFLMSKEAHVAKIYQDHLLAAKEDSMTVTRCYTGKTCRVIDNDYTKEWAKKEDDIGDFAKQGYLSAKTGVLGMFMGKTKDCNPKKDAMGSGQGIRNITNILSCNEIINQMVSQAIKEIKKNHDLIA